MKKLFPILICIAILLCSCGSGKKISPQNAKISDGFSAKADITYGDLSLTADIVKNTDNTVKMTVTSPEPLDGLEFSYDGKNLKVAYYGIYFDVPENTATAKSLASAFCSVLEDASDQSKITASADGEKIEISGKIEEGKYTVTMDKKTGSLLTLTVPNMSLICTFTEFNKI